MHVNTVHDVAMSEEPLANMARTKPRPQNSKPHAPNSHIYARINFLYQSAQLLSRPSSSDPNTNAPLSRFYVSTARTVAKKAVLRLSPGLKRTICKRCDLLLIPGATSTHIVENHSRGGRKPWADVLVVECNACGAVKRFPVGMEARKGTEWKLWCEKPDVVIGGEEEKKDEIQKGSSGEGQRNGQEDVGEKESPVGAEAEPIQQGLKDIVTVADATV